MTDDPKLQRWTPEVVIGLLVLLASMILPYIEGVPLGAATACGVFSAWLLGPVNSFLTPPSQRGGTSVPPNQRGVVRVHVLVLALLGGALAWVLSGCGSLERNGRDILIPLRDAKSRPWPACSYRFEVDGDTLHYGEVDRCPEVPMCRIPEAVPKE